MKLILLFFLAELTFSQSFKERTETKLAKLYPDYISLSYKMIKLSKSISSKVEQEVRQRFFRSELNTWKLLDKDSTVHFIVLDNVIGKVQPITFLLIANNYLSIEFVEVMKYREAYGGEIARLSFRNQFIGKNAQSPIKKASDIKNISGATISVSSLTRGVKKITLLLDYIKGQYEKL